MIKAAILLAGIVFYAFIIYTLIGDIKEENFTKSFFRIIDTDDNGILTEKEMKNINACEKFDGAKIRKEFKEYGRKADLNVLASQFTPKQILKYTQPCFGDVNSAVNVDKIKELNKGDVQKFLTDAYDFNNNNEIKWAEFNIGNQFLTKKQKNLRSIFKFFDRDNNWKISEKELQRAKPKNIELYLQSGKRK